MLPGACVDALDPQGSHVTFLLFATSVSMLQGLVHAGACYAVHILGPVQIIIEHLVFALGASILAHVPRFCK